MQTADAIAQGRLRPIVDPALAEMYLGDWEGMTAEEGNLRHQGAYQQWRISPSTELTSAFSSRLSPAAG